MSILPNIMTMLLSSLLQGFAVFSTCTYMYTICPPLSLSLFLGNALNTVANFFSQLVLLDIAGLRFQDIFEVNLIKTQLFIIIL